MKKITTLIVSILLLLSLSFSSNAKATFETSYDLYESWAGVNNYPDYVCGVWCTYGNTYHLTIAVLDTEEGHNGKNEILSLIEDDSTVAFAYGEYSRDHLTKALNEFTELFKTSEEHGIVAAGLMDKENRLSVTVGEKFKSNEKTQEILDNLKSEYGDIFVISYTKEPISIEELEYSSSTDISIHDEKSTPDFPTILLLLILVFCIAFMVVRKRRQMLLKTTTGEVIASTELSQKDVEKLIENSDITYPQELDKIIIDTIDSIQ